MTLPKRQGSVDSVNFGGVDLETARNVIRDRGLYIARDIVPKESIVEMRNAWLTFCNADVPAAPIIWGPFLGEPNRLLYHESETCCMYRSYDFLWNPPMERLTRDVGIHLNRIRNNISECETLTGETMETDRYGIYITTSYYPSGQGWMANHRDEVDHRRHWHFMLLLTFKGDAYTKGGLTVEDKQGQIVDVDAEVNPGDVIFFDGSCAHGVNLISGGAGIGRLQMFSIPTLMEMPGENDRLLEDISIRRFLKAKLRPYKYRLKGVLTARKKGH